MGMQKSLGLTGSEFYNCLMIFCESDTLSPPQLSDSAQVLSRLVDQSSANSLASRRIHGGRTPRYLAPPDNPRRARLRRSSYHLRARRGSDLGLWRVCESYGHAVHPWRGRIGRYERLSLSQLMVQKGRASCQIRLAEIPSVRDLLLTR